MRYAAQFQVIFGVPLKNYWHPITKFDIIKFDEFIAPPDNQSLKDKLLEKYGSQAVRLIQNLIRS